MRHLPIPRAGFGCARAPVLSALLLLCGLCAALTAPASPLPLSWRADWPNCKPVEKLLHRGVDVALQPTFYINGSVADTNGWAFSTFVQTNAVGAWFGPLPGAFFSHTNDVGAAFYNVMVRAETPGGSVNYTAFARFRMLDSPGFTPGELPLPAKVIDFADVTVLNPPWGEGGGGDFTTNNTVLVETIEAVAPAPGNYAAVSNAAMNALSRAEAEAGFTEWTLTGMPSGATDIQGPSFVSDPPQYFLFFSYNGIDYEGWTNVSGEDVTSVVFDCTNVEDTAPHITVTATRTRLPTMADFDGKASTNDVADALAKLQEELEDGAILVYEATRAELSQNSTYAFALYNEDTDEGRIAEAIFAQLDAATATNAAQSSQLSTLGSQVNAIGAHLNAEDARFVSTNYNSETRMAEAYVEVQVSNSWLTVWREMTRWDWFLGIYTNDFAALSAALASKGEREYAFYDGVTGEPAPDGFFWVSQPRIAIAAGMSYQSYVDSAGAVWVLESNGMVADLNGTTNGYFRISDDEGNSQFEIVKGSARTVGAVAGALARTEVMGVTHWHTTYAVTNAATAPVAMYTRDLTSGEWFAETDVGCPVNVSWTSPDPGVYVCEWWPKSTEPTMFMKAEYGQGSETRIRQVAPVEMQSIVVGGVKYTLGTATIDGVTVLTATRQ